MGGGGGKGEGKGRETGEGGKDLTQHLTQDLGSIGTVLVVLLLLHEIFAYPPLSCQKNPVFIPDNCVETLILYWCTTRCLI